ncbi:sce7726 family protein [Vibrio sp. 03-59-1]|uniref:sce7726 family protein n=1 Tax=Vibrio sp. 03-59-1 TaxID=2607607 RepID=UPI001493A70D|nr:sce7726 family protein [Vibrio sp. 03-59-1]NOH84668.1 sce7726 family protein [Vibrio sp. 03-59-1]
MAENKELKRLLEPDVKALTLNYLRDKRIIAEDSIIMNELTVGNFARRVDLAIYSNGKLVAFEIKSEADTLARLNGQLDKYLEYFDKVIVVSDTKFIPTLTNSLPKNVGLWEVNSSKIIVKQRGKYQCKIDNSKLISMMDVVDLSKLSTKLNIQSERNRSSLEDSLKRVSNKNLRSGVHASLSRKFLGVTHSFIEETKDRAISKDDLKILSRFSTHREKMKSEQNKSRVFWDNIEQHIADLSQFVKASTQSG